MKCNTNEKERSSNIELFRIILMFLIVAHHYVVNSGFQFDYSDVTGNMIFLQIFGMFGKTVINCFTIITGFFMIKSNITIKKFLKLFIQVETYYVFFYFLFVGTGYWEFSIKECIKTVFWFIYETNSLYVGTYVLFFLFIPFLNTFVKSINKKQYELILLLLIMYYSVFSTIFMHNTFDFLGWMITSYLIGGYLRLYLPKKFDNVRIGFIGTLFSVILMVCSIIFVDFCGQRIGIDEWYFFVSDSNKLIPIITSIFSFIWFKNINIRHSKVINLISSATFGVLLFHANGWPMRNFLWKTVFKNAEFYDKSILPIHAIFVVLGVYCIGTFIELFRIRFIEKHTNSLIEKSKLISFLEMRLKTND